MSRPDPKILPIAMPVTRPCRAKNCHHFVQYDVPRVARKRSRLPPWKKGRKSPRSAAGATIKDIEKRRKICTDPIQAVLAELPSCRLLW